MAILAIVVLAIPLAIPFTVGSSDAVEVSSRPPPSIGVGQNRTPVTAVANLPLENRSGDTVTLGQIGDRVVFPVRS